MENLQPKLRFPEFRDVLKVDAIENICKVDTGNKDTQNKVEDGEYPFFVRSNNVEKINSYSYDGEAVLTSGDGVGVGKNYHYINGKFDYHQRVYCMKDFKNINARYFYYQFSNKFYNRVMRMTAKNSVDSVRREMITKMDFFIPTLQEQTKIANFLGAVDKQLDILNQKKEKLNLYKKGTMQQLFSQQIRFKDDNGNNFPEWEEKTLGEIGQIISGLTYSPKDVVDEGLLVLRSSNIQDNKLSFKDNVFVNVNKYNPVETDDILICVRNGSKNLIGKNALITDKEKGFAFGAFMTIYRSKSNKYIFQWMQHSTYKEYVNKNLGATINSINGNDLKKFALPFPSLDEQTKIANFLSAIDTQIEAIENQITKTETYKKGLLQQMFV